MQADRAFLVLGLASFALATTASAGQVYDLGRPATPDEIARWNIDIDPAGAGLPPGAGSVREGAAVYARRCAACH
ncbi:MAG: cytochrome c, partial [Roseiarcus sp.]